MCLNAHCCVQFMCSDLATIQLLHLASDGDMQLLVNMQGVFFKEISLLSLHSILIISTHNKVSIIQLQCQDLSLTNGKVFQSTYYHIIITLYNLLFCFLKGNILSSISILCELFIIVVDRSIYFLFCIFYFVIAGCYICTLLTLFSHTSWQNLSCYEHSLYLPLLQELN